MYLYIYIYIYTYRTILKVHQLNITKKTKKDCKKSSAKDIKTYPRKKTKMKKKESDMGVTNIEICLKTKNKGWLNIEKII